jgi:hypothetical protein
MSILLLIILKKRLNEKKRLHSFHITGNYSDPFVLVPLHKEVDRVAERLRVKEQCCDILKHDP